MRFYLRLESNFFCESNLAEAEYFDLKDMF